MKKLISVVLLLAMCLSLFAGCNQNAENTASNLENAKARLFNMYKPASKDEVPSKSTDFEVVTSILVDGTSYAVEWSVNVTAGAADAVKIVDGSSDSYKKVDLTEKPEETVNFTLTATIKDDKDSVTVSFNYIIPAVQAPTASTVVFYFPDSTQYITGTDYLYESSSGSKKHELVLSDNKADALPMNMVDNGDDTVSFVAEGQYLFCDGTDVKFVSEQGDYTKFVLEAADADGGYFIKCAVANYNGKAQYLEVYSGYLTCYSMNESKANIYTFKLEDAAGASGVLSSSGSTEEPVTPPATNPPATNPPATNPPATNPPAVTTGASVTFDFSSLDKKGVEITADEALALFNGAASGSGLVSVTPTKVYNGNGTGGAYPETAGLLKLGTGKVDGALEMTFGKKVAKVEILCHDWYTMSDQYPTNSNTISVNGCEAVLAPYTADATAGTLTFNLDGSSETVSIVLDNTGNSFGRVFIFKIIVTFAE